MAHIERLERARRDIDAKSETMAFEERQWCMRRQVDHTERR